MKRLKFLPANLKAKLPMILILVSIVISSATGAIYAKYVKNVDKDVVTSVVSNGEVEIEIVKNSEGDYTIRHTSNSKIPAYIRFTVIANWKSTTDDAIWYLSPESVTVNAPCAQLVDGYYYCVADTKAEIALGTTLDGITVTTTESAPAGYEFNVQILAEAIQCMPAGVVEDAWGVTYNGTAWTN